MKVRVYWNFHKKLFSVQAQVNGRWKVVEHSENLFLTDVQFKVSESGRQRVLREKRKNVHAKIHGELTTIQNRGSLRYARGKVKYNPYTMDSFMVFDADQIIPPTRISNCKGIWLTVVNALSDSNDIKSKVVRYPLMRVFE